MGLPQEKRSYTPEEYFRLEREAPYKSDYYNGEIFAMAGGTSRHSLIVMNIGGELRQRLKGAPCAAYESNQRLTIKSSGLRVYPDVSIYCGPLEYDELDTQSETATNPTVLFEVLSPSTEAYDRGLKSESYRQIVTLQAYVMISQDKPHVEIYERRPDGLWLLRDENGLNAVLKLTAVSVLLPLAEIYDRIEFLPPISEAAGQ